MSNKADPKSFPPNRLPRNAIAIEFPDDVPRMAGQLAQDLKIAIDKSIIGGSVKATTSIEKLDENAQDIGTILAIILGANATVAVATGIAAWLRRSNQGSIRIVKPDGSSTVIKNADSADMAKIMSSIG